MERVKCLAVLAFIGVASCGPNLSKLHLSQCTGSCNAQAKVCLDSTTVELSKCSSGDNVCLYAALKNTEACLTTCLDCIHGCTAEAESQLKQ